MPIGILWQIAAQRTPITTCLTVIVGATKSNERHRQLIVPVSVVKIIICRFFIFFWAGSQTTGSLNNPDAFSG